MPGRFLIQKFSSRVSRSAGALATGPASEGGVRAPSNLFNGATAHPRPMVPSNRGIHGYEGGIKTVSDLFHRDGAAVHPGTMVHVIRGYVHRSRAEMAGRFLIQKFSSQVSRSAGALATSPASEGGVRVPSNLFNGATAHLRSMVPSNRGIHGYEGGIKTVSDLFHIDGAAVHPGTMVPINHVIRGYAAMCLNTCPCSRAAAKTNCRTGVPSIMVNGMQPVFACSVSGSKRAFSCTASSAHEVSVEAETACSKGGMAVEGGDDKFMRRQKWLWGFTIVASMLGFVFDELRPSKRSKQASG